MISGERVLLLASSLSCAVVPLRHHEIRASVVLASPRELLQPDVLSLALSTSVPNVFSNPPSQSCHSGFTIAVQSHTSRLAAQCRPAAYPITSNKLTTQQSPRPTAPVPNSPQHLHLPRVLPSEPVALGRCEHASWHTHITTSMSSIPLTI